VGPASVVRHDAEVPVTDEGSTLVTVGYEGRTAEQLVRAVAEDCVDILVDVRLTPSSRKPGLSKGKLSAALAQAGVEYLHLRALGNPRDNRAGYRTGDPASQRRYAEVLHDEAASDALEQLESLVNGARVALLCFERDSSACHRQAIADELRRRRPDLRLQHV
jgi:uncharacterized protein (DUF488 family)